MAELVVGVVNNVSIMNSGCGVNNTKFCVRLFDIAELVVKRLASKNSMNFGRGVCKLQNRSLNKTWQNKVVETL